MTKVYPDGVKRCTQCNTEKSLDQFYVRRRPHRVSPEARCKACSARTGAQWFQTHREAYNAKRQAQRRADPTKRDRRPFASAERHARKKAERYGVPYEVVSYVAILERDGERCHICDELVPRDNLTFDHVISISRGGPHTPENIRVAHRRCNDRKHAGSLEQVHARFVECPNCAHRFLP